MQRRALRVALCWCLGAAAVGAVARGSARDRGSLSVGYASVGAIILILACHIYSEAMTQSRANGLTTTRAHQAWLLSLCFWVSVMIIGFPVNLLMVWSMRNIRVAAVEALRSFEHGDDAPDVLGLYGVSTNAILGSLAAVSVATLWRLYIQPRELWRAAAPSAVRASERMKKRGSVAMNPDYD